MLPLATSEHRQPHATTIQSSKRLGCHRSPPSIAAACSYGTVQRKNRYPPPISHQRTEGSRPQRVVKKHTWLPNTHTALNTTVFDLPPHTYIPHVLGVWWPRPLRYHGNEGALIGKHPSLSPLAVGLQPLGSHRDHFCVCSPRRFTGCSMQSGSIASSVLALYHHQVLLLSSFPTFCTTPSVCWSCR